MNAVVATAQRPAIARGVVRLLAFDLWRFRWLALLIVALEIARAAFIEWAMHVVPPVIGERFGGSFGTQEVPLVDAVLALSAALATAVLVQADLPSDDRAFWRTRPIAPLGLALAKLTTLLLLFVVAPAALNAGRLLAYGASIEAIAAAAVQVAVGAGYVILPAWGLALITRTLPRFVVAAVASVLGSLLAASAGLYWAEVWSLRGGNTIALGLQSLLVDWQGVGTAGWWSALGVTVAAAMILTWHYEHRRAALSASAVVMLLVVSRLLPAPGTSSASPALVQLVSERLDVTGLTLPSDRPVAARPATRSPVSVDVVLALPGLPADVRAAVHLRGPTLRGPATVATGDGWQCCFGAGEASVIAPALVQPPARAALPPTTRQGLPVATDDLGALRGRTVTFEANAEVHLGRHKWMGTIPLRRGAAFRSGGRVLEVLAWEPTLDPTHIALVRYTEFPSLASPDVTWTLFAGDGARTRASKVSNWGPASPAQALIGRTKRWGSGRTWVGRFHVFVEGAARLGPDPLIYIVESRAIGTVRLALRTTGLQTRAGAPAR
jgi:hypothetical protein